MKRKLFKLLLVGVIGLTSLHFIKAQDNKADLVNKLIGLTADSHPSVMEQRMVTNKVNANKYQAEERRNYASFLTLALKENNQLTTEQKAFARKNLEKLVDRVAFEVLAIRNRNNNQGKWLRESLLQNYSTKLTVAELNNLADYFAKEEGKNTLNYLATSPERKASGKPNYSPEEFLAYSDFVIKTELGNKFFKIFVTDAEADIMSKFTAGNKQMLAELNKLYKSAPLNQIINQFVADNLEPGKSNKTNVVSQLVETTISWQKEINKDLIPMSADRNEENAKIQTENFASIFDEALKVNKSLTPDQMAFAKANYSKLSEILEAKQKALVTDLLPVETWMKKGLTTAFTNYLTIDEINIINAFLQSPAAKNLNRDMMTEMELVNSGFAKFAETAAGSKFFTILKNDILKSSEPEMKKGYQKYMEASFKLLDPTGINQIISEFVAANYKK